MLLLRTTELADGPGWLHELKLDGFRAVAFKTGGKVYLRSRNDNDFAGRYPTIIKALTKLPDDTVIDGEVVALDQDGRPSFNALQNYGSAHAPLLYYVFDVLVLAGKEVMSETLSTQKRVAGKEGSVETNRADPLFAGIEREP